MQQQHLIVADDSDESLSETKPLDSDQVLPRITADYCHMIVLLLLHRTIRILVNGVTLPPSLLLLIVVPLILLAMGAYYIAPSRWPEALAIVVLLLW